MDKVENHLLAYFGLLLVVISFTDSFRSYDSTDPPGERSGLGLLVDAHTGCHYLTTARGGITPRYDRDGNHICTGPEKEP